MPDDPEEFLAYLTHLRAEHRELDQRLRRIERDWIGESDAAVAQAIRELEALRVDLARHFQEEESGGCLEEAVSRQPSLGCEADRLVHEHREMLRGVDQLIVKLKGLTRLVQRSDEAREDFRRFAEQLHAHESAEDRILRQSFGIELE